MDQARLLAAGGDYVAIHLDARAPKSVADQLAAMLAGCPNLHLVKQRQKCGWGEWSLVQATLNSLTEALRVFPKATHFYLISGDCMPIQPAVSIRAALRPGRLDYIETQDFFTSGWIKTGLKEERVIYRHPFNERSQRVLFYGWLMAQQWLGLTRPVPRGLKLRIGSQWWCLRRATAQALLDLSRAKPGWIRFFKTSWIPDEICIQSLVAHLVPEAERSGAPPTFLRFTDYGMPLTFHNDHYDWLISQPEFFARKISPQARALKQRLAERYRNSALTNAKHWPGSDQGRGFLATRGRLGHRVPPAPWTRAGLGSHMSVTVVLSKAWHLGKAVMEQIPKRPNQLSLGYLFDEDCGGLPNLGGYGDTAEQRRRDPAKTLGLIAELSGARRLFFCLDPSRFELLQLLAKHPCQIRLLRLDHDLTEGFATGHGMRLGVLQPDMPVAISDTLHSVITADLQAERAALNRLNLPSFVITNETPPSLAGRYLTEALDIEPGLANDLLASLDLTGE